MATILVADDDGHIREVLRYALERAGHRVLEAGDGARALELAAEPGVDLLLLDILMPEADGLTVCREILARRRLPIVFLTSRADELDRVLGLELGADDYVVKPFSPREVVARVKAVLRRAQAPAAEPRTVLACGPLSLDPDRRTCHWAAHEVALTATEFALLAALMARPGKVYTRDELVTRAYGLGHAITDRTIDSHVRRIRRKLAEAGADEPLETVHGVGYRLREP